jgi:hypothetical protein
MNEIKKAFKFDEKDLAENRRGMSTASQIERLKTKGCFFTSLFLQQSTHGVLAVVAFGVLLVLLNLGLPSSAIAAHEILAKMLRIVMLMGAVSLACGFIPILFLSQKRRDRQERRVASCNGEFLISSRYDSAYKRLRVSGLTFKITNKEARALRPYRGKQLTIYYFPRSRQIASVEVIP